MCWTRALSNRSLCWHVIYRFKLAYSGTFSFSTERRMGGNEPLAFLASTYGRKHKLRLNLKKDGRKR